MLVRPAVGVSPQVAEIRNDSVSSFRSADQRCRREVSGVQVSVGKLIADSAAGVTLGHRTSVGEIPSQSWRVARPQKRRSRSGVRHAEWCPGLDDRDAADRPVGERYFLPTAGAGEERQIVPVAHHESVGPIEV